MRIHLESFIIINYSSFILKVKRKFKFHRPCPEDSACEYGLNYTKAGDNRRVMARKESVRLLNLYQPIVWFLSGGVIDNCMEIIIIPESFDSSPDTKVCIYIYIYISLKRDDLIHLALV